MAQRFNLLPCGILWTLRRFQRGGSVAMFGIDAANFRVRAIMLTLQFEGDRFGGAYGARFCQIPGGNPQRAVGASGDEGFIDVRASLSRPSLCKSV